MSVIEKAPGSTPAVSLSARTAAFDAVLVSAIGLGFIIVLLRDSLFPPKFSYDAARIRALADGTGFSVGDTSYDVSAAFYRMIGLATNDTAAALLGYSLMVLAILIVRVRARQFAPSLWAVVALAAAAVFGAIYLGTYAKDILIVPIGVLALIPSRRFGGDALLVAAMLLCGLGYREYWLLVAVAYVACRVLFLRKLRLRHIILIAVAGVLAISLAFAVILRVDPDHFRTIVNAGRVGSADAASMIMPFVSLPQPVGGTVNAVLTLLTLVFPLPLVLQLDAYHVLSGLVIAAIMIPTVRAIPAVTGARGFAGDVAGGVAGGFAGDVAGGVAGGFARDVARGVNPGFAPGANGSSIGVASARAASLLVAFLVVQALFEPDYGSALRHFTSFMPLAGLVIWNAHEARSRAAAR